MPATTPRQFRLTEAELARLDDLGRRWGPVKPLTRTEVIREMIRRAAANLTSDQTTKPRKPKGQDDELSDPSKRAYGRTRRSNWTNPFAAMPDLGRCV